MRYTKQGRRSHDRCQCQPERTGKIGELVRIRQSMKLMHSDSGPSEGSFTALLKRSIMTSRKDQWTLEILSWLSLVRDQSVVHQRSGNFG